jgi:hypothetical protein
MNIKARPREDGMNPLWMDRGRHKRRTLVMLLIISSTIMALAYLPWRVSVANAIKPSATQQQARDMPPVSMPPLSHTLNELFRHR